MMKIMVLVNNNCSNKNSWKINLVYKFRFQIIQGKKMKVIIYKNNNSIQKGNS